MEEGTIPEVHGEITGLKSSQLKALERLYRRKIAPNQVTTPELSRAMCEISREMGRQVGMLVSRVGKITHVVVGDAHGIHLPDFGRMRAGRDRFRGLRLLHTHLNGEGLTRDDLTDLALLRLDLCFMVQAMPNGMPGEGQYAYLMAPNQDGDLWQTEDFKSVWDVHLDFQDFIRSLESEFSQAIGAQEADGREKAIIVGVAQRGDTQATERLDELERLVDTAGLHVIDRVLQFRHRIDPKFVMGRGKLEEVVIRSMQVGADLLIFDRDLRPSQLRSIANRTDLKVLDRTQVILDIFAQRAQSKAGKLQVELAQLRYLMPRLGIMNTAMSRLTGGIGGRGPGETKLEINRRRANERLTRLNRELKKVSGQRAERRKGRERSGVPVVSLVGYTNAGKSTLLNRMTQSKVVAEDQLFATLDPVSRRLRFPREREIILTDTVGFIRDLPKDLIAAFKATLEELEVADVLLHVVDASAEDVDEQMEATEEILDNLGVSDKPRLMVLNKVDLASPEQVTRLEKMKGGLPISAQSGKGCAHLMRVVEEMVWNPRQHSGDEHEFYYETPPHKMKDWQDQSPGETPVHLRKGVVSADDMDI